MASASSHTTKLLIILCSAKLIRLRWLSLSNKPNLFVYAEGSRFGKIKRIFAFALDLFVSLADRLRYSRSAKSNKFAFAPDLFVSLQGIHTLNSIIYEISLCYGSYNRTINTCGPSPFCPVYHNSRTCANRSCRCRFFPYRPRYARGSIIAGAYAHGQIPCRLYG